MKRREQNDLLDLDENLQVLVAGGSSVFDFLSAFNPFFFILLFLLLHSILSSSLLYFFPFGFLFPFFFCSHFLSSVFSPLQYFFFFLDPPVCSPVLSPFDSFLPLSFIGFHAAYLPRTMIRPGDIGFQSDWGTNSPAPWWTPFYKHEGVRNSSLSLHDCNLQEDKICNLSSSWTGMPVFHNFLSFFAGGLSASEEEEEEQCMFETVSFWTGNDHFSIWSLRFPNFTFKRPV